MKILVIGSGGREHALVWRLAQAPSAARIYCAPGNAGIARERVASSGEPVTCVPIGAKDLPNLLAWANTEKPDLTIVGPDDPLAMGLVDRFAAAGLKIWGPNQQAARFESSKAFAHGFMERHGIPTARAGVFQQADEALRFCESLQGRCAVKADGLALGKGVLLTETIEEAHAAVHAVLVEKQFGQAGHQAVIQERLSGMEVSLHALCDGKTGLLFPSSQDHKRALDGDQGQNTGGMGTYSPAPFLTNESMDKLKQAILVPWLKGCREENIDFRGILYPGVMLTESGPRVLEFNARFGDPETQVYLPRLRSDLLELLAASADGSLGASTMEWNRDAAVCVVIASGGYPGKYEKGKRIRGLDEVAAMPGVKVFHAGTAGPNGGPAPAEPGGDCFTNGGRVLGVTAWSKTVSEARNTAYEAVDRIQFEGKQFRRDIALKAVDTVPGS